MDLHLRHELLCPSGYRGASGQLASVKDPNGNLLCYSYDTLSCVTGVNANGTTCRWFYYDNSSGYTGTLPSGIALTNQYGHLVEATTDACVAVVSHTSSTIITDEWFAYDKDGHKADLWELTPHSTQYYHSHVASFYGNGVPTSVALASPSLYTMAYGRRRRKAEYACGFNGKPGHRHRDELLSCDHDAHGQLDRK